jgi:hypothetical protein
MQLRPIALVAVLLPTAAAADASPEPAGCADLRMMEELYAAYASGLPADDKTAAADDANLVHETAELVCTGKHQKGATVRYANGKTATASWGTPGVALYYSNGKHLTAAFARKGVAYYWPNGKHLTAAFAHKGVSYYWPSGKHLTAAIGSKGVSWYYANGKHLTAAMGTPGATWYRADGNHWTTGPAIAEDVLLERPGCIVQLALAHKLPDASSCKLGQSPPAAAGSNDARRILAACEKLHSTDREILACIRGATLR